ncbi:MAG: hypothetical protein ACREEM_18575 [Blastocatellia bacterium]
MVSTKSLSQIEELIVQLSRQERLLLIERLAHRLREEVNGGDSQNLMTEQRVIALLQQDIRETPAERGARLWHEASLNHNKIVAAWDAAMKEMGICGEPIGAEKLQEMMIAEGVNPESNEFSRGIIEMREE